MHPGSAAYAHLVLGAARSVIAASGDPGSFELA